MNKILSSISRRAVTANPRPASGIKPRPKAGVKPPGVGRTKTAPVDGGPDGTTAVYFAVTYTWGKSDAVLGTGCQRLTKLYSKYNVSCHVLPGVVNDQGDAAFAVIGTTKAGVQRAVNDHRLRSGRSIELADIRVLPYKLSPED